jgi:hypothetical protein
LSGKASATKEKLIACASDSIAVGRRIEVFWPKEDSYFVGTVVKVGTKSCQVQYDDGDVGFVVFGDDEYRLLSSPHDLRSNIPASKSKVVKLQASPRALSKSLDSDPSRAIVIAGREQPP